MTRALFTLIFVLVANGASAYEFHLQFSTPPGARDVSIIGYQFTGNTVVGDCTYVIIPPCSGRGCHSNPVYYYNTCTWDLYGDLLNVATGAPPTQSPLYTNGTEVVYAVSDDGTSTPSPDSAGFGFVATPSQHYS